MNEKKKNNTHKKHLKWLLHIWKLRIYITWDFRLKNSQMRDQKRNHNKICTVKNMLWKKHDGHCQICGKRIKKYRESQLHHILNWCKFPEYETDERNLLLLCSDCHNNIHKSALLELKMQIQKAKELGINLYDYYNKEDVDVLRKYLCN